MKQKIFLSMSRVNSQQINNYFLSGTGQSSAMKFVLNCLLVLPKKKKKRFLFTVSSSPVFTLGLLVFGN